MNIKVAAFTVSEKSINTQNKLTKDIQKDLLLLSCIVLRFVSEIIGETGVKPRLISVNVGEL